MATTNKDGIISAHDELQFVLHPDMGLPTRKAADTFVCDCGMELSAMIPPSEEAYHRSHYHNYCGQCKSEPCQCWRGEEEE